MRRRLGLLTVAGAALALAGGVAGPAMAQGWGPGGHPGMGMPGGGPMGMFEAFDTNKDGKLTQDEINAVRDQRLAQFDANKDGQLSLEEYKALWLDAMQRPMVRGFQSNDTDGNGQITKDEFRERFAHVIVRLDTNRDGAVTREEVMAWFAVAPMARAVRGMTVRTTAPA